VLVHIIADYGMGDLAFAEVVQRIKVHLPDTEPVLTPVPAFSTIAAGFCIAQIGTRVWCRDSRQAARLYTRTVPLTTSR
jgi:hypothetical protein